MSAELRALPRRLGVAALLAAIAFGYACRSPTEIRVTVTTDPGLCGATVETVLAAGAPGEVAPVAESSARVSGCPDDAPAGKVGSLVVIPSGDRGAKIEVRVVRGIGRRADECEAAHFDGCIVARRILRFVAHEPLELPIATDAQCIGKDCPAGTSCSQGACYPYDPDAPGYCADPAHGGCVAADAGADVTAGPPKACPSAHGPTMVRVDTGAASFCIDSTEVTDTQFTVFANANVVPPLPAECGNVTSFQPQGIDDLPVVFVDWCDATAYCAWAGKRLCKSLDGSSPSGQDAAIGTSEWYLACSRGGTQAYPYGKGPYDPEACKTVNSGTPDTGRRDVGLYPTCVGGYPGIFDLCGSVHEWVDGCDAKTGPNDSCRLEGASFTHKNPDEFRCDSAYFAGDVVPRNQRLDDVGFRCCAD